MKLHIGGEKLHPDWKILNIQPREGVDFVGDIRDLSHFKSESIDEIYASHVVEHIPKQDIKTVFEGVHRVLRVGGKFYISVPDLNILCQTFLHREATLGVKLELLMMIFGGQRNAHDFHYFGWDLEILAYFLNEAKFKTARRVNSFGLFDDYSDYKPFGFPISLNVIAEK